MAWCKHLESHSDYEHRLPRGRSYLRQGNVYNLAIEPGAVTATVAGSELYEVRVTIQPLAARLGALEGGLRRAGGSLLDLSAASSATACCARSPIPIAGSFPKPREIRLSCSCPDYADMCKHVAAVLYGVGVQLEPSRSSFSCCAASTLRNCSPPQQRNSCSARPMPSLRVKTSAPFLASNW